MSIIAARHICMGEWHNAFLDLEADFNLWIPTGAANSNWLKNYIDSVLFSDQYIAKFGVLPYMVGFHNEKDIHDFDLNRRSFAERCLTNKYGETPNFQQMFQGSKEWLIFGIFKWRILGIEVPHQPTLNFFLHHELIHLPQMLTWQVNVRLNFVLKTDRRSSN